MHDVTRAHVPFGLLGRVARVPSSSSVPSSSLVPSSSVPSSSVPSSSVPLPLYVPLSSSVPSSLSSLQSSSLPVLTSLPVPSSSSSLSQPSSSLVLTSLPAPSSSSSVPSSLSQPSSLSVTPVIDKQTTDVFIEYGAGHPSIQEWLLSLHIPRNVENLQQIKDIWEVGQLGCPPLKKWTPKMRRPGIGKSANHSSIFKECNFREEEVKMKFNEVKPGKLYKLLSSKDR
ncbi:hypothetical protein AC249_AIPGENE10218 [Exaiptasia diaphana]|nr:hypothetical protein AC249_AIPGENE10218 [Exaiptasia diaphana]